MTKTKYRTKPVYHETQTLYDGRAICIAESSSELLVRLKGTRQVLSLPYSMVYLRAATLKATMDSLNKINAKRRRKSAGVVRGRIGR